MAALKHPNLMNMIELVE